MMENSNPAEITKNKLLKICFIELIQKYVLIKITSKILKIKMVSRLRRL